MTEPSLRVEVLIKTELSAPQTPESLIDSFSKLSAQQLGTLFVTSLFLRSVLKPLIDEEWLRQQQGVSRAQDVRAQQIKNELRSLSFLSGELTSANSLTLKTYFNRMTHFIHVLVSFIQVEAEERFRETLAVAMRLIDVRARELDTFPANVFSEAMYRAFDEFDELLGIRYDLDLQMASDPDQRERLYEGAGIGVQTSYSSILLALDRANIKKGARVLDLGSGYGRVGFVLGLLRPDISFTGYEYVNHRVLDSKAVCKRLALANIEFETRDLSAFQLPRADVYYMYDPFSRETYAFVLNQLIAYGGEQPVTIITKGRANTWVRDALVDHGWMIDDTCDSGTVCLFKTPSSVSA
jgi:hypothetical protein